MCIRTIKTMLFITACLTVMLFGATLAPANAALVGQVKMTGAEFANVNKLLAVQAFGRGMVSSKKPRTPKPALDGDTPVATPEPSTLFLIGTGLVLTGTALRRKEGKKE